MTDPKEQPQISPDIPFDEAITRFIQTDPKELADAHRRLRDRQEEINRGAKEVEAEIRGGIRPPGKRFRL